MLRIPLNKKVLVDVPNGEMVITQEGTRYILEYINPIYVGSPFKMPTSFSTEYGISEILNSPEVRQFLSRFQ